MIKYKHAAENRSSFLKRLFLTLYHLMGDLKLFLISTIAVILFFVIFTIIELQIDPNGPGAITSFQLAFSSDRSFQLLNQWGPSGIELFKIALLIDMLFPMTYVMMLASGIAYFSKNPESDQDVPSIVLLVFSFPFLAAIFDWSENFLQFIMVTDRTFISNATVLLVGMYAILKFILLGISGLFLAYLILSKNGLIRDK